MESHAFVLGILVLWTSGNFAFPITEDVNDETNEERRSGCGEDDIRICDTGQNENANSRANDMSIMAGPGESVKEVQGFGLYQLKESWRENEPVKETEDSSQLYPSGFDQSGPSISNDNFITSLKIVKVKRSSLFDNLEIDDDNFESANENIGTEGCDVKGNGNCITTGAMPSHQAVENTIDNLEMESDHFGEKNVTGNDKFDFENSENFTDQIHNAEAILQQAIMSHNPGVTTTEAFWNTDDFISRTSS